MTRASFSHSVRPLPARLALSAVFMAMALAAGSASASGGLTDGTPARAVEDTGYALVQLVGEPLSTYVRTQPPKGKKIDFTSNTARAYRAQLSNLRNDYKAWLRTHVPGASVTGEFDISLNAVSVKLSGATLAQVSSTAMVRSAQYQGLFYPNTLLADPDLPLIRAQQAWARNGGTAATAGAGIKVAIVDSGIDQTHPCFDDNGYETRSRLGDPRFTNNKVIVAKVFNNRLPQNRFTAEAVSDHGTHVAGTVACNYLTPANVNGVATYAMSGVAPKALLGNYNVFPGSVASARSEDILNALEAAYADGFDIANMSLGGGSQGVRDLLTHAVDNLDRANMVVAVSNGNSGPAFFTVGSPGMAARALTAGASSVPHLIATPVTAKGNTYGAAVGDFATVTNNLTAPLGVVSTPTVVAATGLGDACTPLVAGSLNGTIALLSRGNCTFAAKVRNAQNAGAAAVLVVNNRAGDPSAMAGDGSSSIPAYMVGLPDGIALRNAGAGTSTTISATQSYFQTAYGNIMADFSSLGPTDVDFRVKPDVVAPGGNVLSSLPRNACSAHPCFAFFSGTSMAAPHLAGSAAVIRGQHPAWSAEQVRSAVVNTAQRNVLKKSANIGALELNVNVVGAGLQDLNAAVNASVALDPVSLSFGAVPSGSGQTRQLSMTLTNIGTEAKTLDLSVGTQPNGVTYSVTPATVLLAVGASAQVKVTMKAAVGAAGQQQAYLEITEGGALRAHAALFTIMK